MAHQSDDIYLGGFLPTGLYLGKTTAGERQQGVGPMGRIVFLNIVPLALAVANIAALQAPTANTALVLTATAGITTGRAPDGSGATVFQTDVPRAISLTSTANLSASTVTITGFDKYGRKQTQTLNGPNNNTVNTLKAFASVLSVVPAGTSASQISIGTADVFGLDFACQDVGYLINAGWNNTQADNAGTLTTADTTSPATSATGDTRGTFAQSGAASNGARRLVLSLHLDGTQCGPNATQLAVLGVTPA